MNNKTTEIVKREKKNKIPIEPKKLAKKKK